MYLYICICTAINILHILVIFVDQYLGFMKAFIYNAIAFFIVRINQPMHNIIFKLIVTLDLLDKSYTYRPHFHDMFFLFVFKHELSTFQFRLVFSQQFLLLLCVNVIYNRKRIHSHRQK